MHGFVIMMGIPRGILKGIPIGIPRGALDRIAIRSQTCVYAGFLVCRLCERARGRVSAHGPPAGCSTPNLEFRLLHLVASETKHASARGSGRATCASGLSGWHRRMARAVHSARSKFHILRLHLVAPETQPASTRGSGIHARCERACGML